MSLKILLEVRSVANLGFKVAGSLGIAICRDGISEEGKVQFLQKRQDSRMQKVLNGIVNESLFKAIFLCI